MTDETIHSRLALNTEAMLGLNRLRRGAEPEADSPFAAQRRADGMWDVPITADTAARLDSVRYPGESDSDVIIRLIAVTQRPLS